MDLDRESYYREKLVKIVLTETTIQSREFDECEFENCSFIACRFEKCRFLNCTFRKCDLSAVVPMNSDFTGVQFSGCKMIGVDWTKAQEMKELSFSECLLNYSNFRMLKLPHLKMVKCEAKEIDFIEADLSHANFKGTDFEKSVFFKTNLANADFRYATNYSIDITTNVIKKAWFSLPEAMSLLSALDITVE